MFFVRLQVRVSSGACSPWDYTGSPLRRQTYFYFIEYPKDKAWLKILVSTLWLLNTIHSALIFHLVYHYLILNAFDPFELSQNIWSLPASMIVLLIMAWLVMTYFLSVIFQCTYPCPIRLQRFLTVIAGSGSKPKLRWWLTVPNGIVILVYIGFGIETVVDLFQTPTLVDLTAYTKISFLPLAATQAGADSMMATSLCFVLFNHRTGFRRTNSLLYTLMMYAINRCLLTAGTAMVALLMIAIKPDSMMYIGPQFLISGLYTNALMATLNSRHRISTGSRESDIVDLNSVHLSNLSPNASELREGNSTRPIRHHGSHSVEVDDFKRDVV
ncbi:hypothetical protein MVEN_00616900 [Mycena venus]|uniref:DUF6534 domain-containing protein n=1 Tax=Mycena venus TaxID=2733690 RepID=A0A8H6YQU8_9AGAR|nr:hypothetical protein MVEN_00616900 [Mycena venus]